MFQKLEMFRTAMFMAQHAGVKQAVTSRNIANADTPAYRAQSIQDFAEFVPVRSSGFTMKATHPQHDMQSSMPLRVVQSSHASHEPNGNSVVLESEILNSVDAKRQHDRALAIYRASLGMIRSALSKQ